MLPAATSPLRAPGAVLLVNCYDLGRRPVAVAAALESLAGAGFSPAVRDLSVEKLEDAALARALLVLISAPMHTALRLGARVASRARELAPAAHVSFFGLYAALSREHLLGRHCDSVAGGEPEAALRALAEALERELAADPAATPRALPRAAVPGASTRAHPAAQPLQKPARPRPSRAASAPADAPPAAAASAGAARAPLPLAALDRYARLELAGETRLVATVEASRGCKHLCRHCPIVPVWRGRFTAVPVDEVMAQLEPQVAAGARHVTFADPDFLNGPSHASRVARALHQRWPELTFDATVKIEHLLAHAALLPELAAAGCLFVTSAVESLSDRVLAALAKGHAAADVPEALRRVRAAGIDLRPTLLPYTPWTALDDLPRLFDFAEEHGLVEQIDPVQYTLRLLLPQGSAVLEAQDGARAAPRPEWLGSFDPERFGWSWRHPDPRVDALQAASAALAERHAAEERPHAQTFQALRRLACGAAGLPAPAELPAPADPRSHPRITEPWFC